MCLETTLSSAAVARGFASYLATLFGLSPSALRLSLGPVQLDFPAALLVLLLTLLLICGTHLSSKFNMGARLQGVFCLTRFWHDTRQPPSASQPCNPCLPSPPLRSCVWPQRG